MNELRPHGRELLEAARRERTPSPAQRERLLSELLAAADPGPASGAPGGTPKLRGGSRWLVLVGLALSIGLALYGASHLGR
jgi:hypothetical protein